MVVVLCGTMRYSHVFSRKHYIEYVVIVSLFSQTILRGGSSIIAIMADLQKLLEQKLLSRIYRGLNSNNCKLLYPLFPAKRIRRLCGACRPAEADRTAEP